MFQDHPDLLPRVYPRVCGGAGTEYGNLEDDFEQGSIPACAGEPWSDALDQTTVAARVYPRVCGGARHE